MAIASVSYPSTFPGLAAAGGQVLVISGFGFGELADNQMDGSLTVKYGTGSDPDAYDYTAIDCSLTVPQTEVTCTTVAGIGTAIRFALSARGEPFELSPSTYSFEPPSLSSIDPALQPSAGATTVTLAGLNFGPVRADIAQPTATTSDGATVNCAVTEADTRMECAGPAGAGVF